MILTVGQVSAIIAAVIFVFQFLVPNAVTLILVGILRQTHSAVTWSVVQRNIFSSHWPLLTNSDSVAARGVDPKVRFITFIKPVGLLLISLAAVVTPLGLHDDVLPYGESDKIAFGHLPDSGPFGYASMSRDGQRFTRICSGYNIPLPCPSTKTQIDFTYNNLGQITNGTIKKGTTYDVNIPQSLIDLFESGLSTLPPSVASFFDIESRLYTYMNITGYNDDQRFVVDTFRMLKSLILDDTIQAVEGLIVNARDGGVGFRNHSVPRDVDLGAEWSEDILFIEPETECVNTNLTYEFTIGVGGSNKYDNENLVIVDDGGFANLNHTYPQVDMSNPQKHPNLRDRAYKAAWMTNAYAMLYMNITRPAPNSFSYLKSKVGQHFPLPSDLTASASANGIFATSLFSNMIKPSAGASSAAGGSNATKPLYANPFNITQNNYTDIGVICQGAGGRDLANATNIHVECGLVFGAARPTDGGETPVVPFPYTRWRQPIYACASTTKASIKQVTFHFNTTLRYDVSALSIINITDKVYADEAAMPRWGVEDIDYTLGQAEQIWGLISDAHANAPNITTFKSPSMRLPGFQGVLTNQLSGFGYIPGHYGPSQALSTIYNTLDNSIYDWTGENNIAMLQRWRQLANSADGVAYIANLIWTDVAANKMTSSKNWNQKAARITRRANSAAPDPEDYANVPVTKFERRVRYKWVFAIPAFIVLALALVVTVTAIILSVVKHSGLHHVRFYTDSLSSGRLLAASQYSGGVDKLAPTKVWVNTAGKYLASLGPIRNGIYQQPTMQQEQQQQMPMSTSVSASTPLQMTPHHDTAQQPSYPAGYRNSHLYGDYQTAPPANTGYIGANAPWSEKGYEYTNTHEITHTPTNVIPTSRPSHNGCSQVYGHEDDRPM